MAGHQRGLLRSCEVDVPPEGLLLHRDTVGPGPEVVQAALADDPNPRVGCETLDLGIRRRQLPRRSKPGNLVGVQGNSREHPGVVLGRGDGEPRPGQVAPDLHHPVDADVGRCRQHGAKSLDRHLGAVPGDVQVGVVVDDRNRQWIRCRGDPLRGGLRTGRHDRPHSWSTSASSSLVNTGAGLTTGAPTSTGVDSHRGVPE